MADPSSTNRQGIISKRIVAKGASREVYVNGTLDNKGSNASTSEGATYLQSEKANIQFRNIRIRE